jgi:hypothetical protein
MAEQRVKDEAKQRTYPIMTLIAPNGVTKIAGAKVYAAKLATVYQLPFIVWPFSRWIIPSPTITKYQLALQHCIMRWAY